MGYDMNNIGNNKVLTITYMEMIITKVRFWTRHTSKIWSYMMICTRIKKPCDRRRYRGIIKREIDIGLEMMISQLRTLLGSMPIFITQLTLYIAIIFTKTVTLLPKLSCCSRGITRGESMSLLSKLLTWGIIVIAMISTISIVVIIIFPAPTKTTSSGSIETKVMLHQECSWLLRWSW